MAIPQPVLHSDLEVDRRPPPPKQQLYDAYPAGPQDGAQYRAGDRNGRTVCGLRPTTFVLSLALLFVILAAGIGGGVGGTLAVKNAKKNLQPQTIITTATATAICASVTPSQTPTSTLSPLSVPTTGTLFLNCPSIDNTNIRTTLKSTSIFTVTCGLDFANNDLLAVIVYNIHDCAQACASYNLNWRSDVCKGAVFNSDLTGSVNANFGTCFLKNGTSNRVPGTLNSYAALVLN